MPGPLVHVGATAICPHGAQIMDIPTNTRVLVSGQPVATLADTYPIVGCPFNVGSAPQPCLTARWLVPAARVMVGGSPAILQTSTGICQGPTQAPQGPALVVSAQTRAVGT
jgi:hypothetical protein